MAMSMGQEKGLGHSHGPLGHGGHHKVAGPVTGSNDPKNSPHVQGHNLGHTMSNSHGGGFPMGAS